ncbi:MAG: hypothetical protein LAP39_21080 [Acidobacteriia bacterium]|nr:hypothetical protein [Terriglobia bacterium]
MDFHRIRELIARWRLKRREASLYRDFVKDRKIVALGQLLSFVAQHDRNLPVERDDFREALFGLDWKRCCDELEAAHREIVFRAVDGYLFSLPPDASSGDWRSWIRMSRAAGRVLTVTEPAFAQGLLGAKRHGKLDDLPKEDSDYLLSCYLRAYGEILERSGVDDRQFALPILLEFAAIAQVLGPTEYSSTILQRWVKHAQQKPRALASFSDDQAYDAPIRGVGSPNGASVTMYQGGQFSTPVRIAYAGTTGDRTLNAQMFSSLFSTALACDNDQSFLTPVGGILHLDYDRSTVTSSERRTVLRATIGIDGPVEPRAGMPSLGMEPDEAFELVAELFQRFRDSTGLVSVMHWGVGDADTLDERVRKALSSGGESTRRLKSEPSHSEAGGVIHVMPLLHRNKDGEIEAIQIPVSYSALNPDLVLKLTRTARQSYMAQLIANGRRREAMAQNAYTQHDRFVKRWQALTEAQKETECKAAPWVTITQSYNFELGMITVVEPPERVSLQEYEERRRPDLRDSAKQYAEKFGALCATLDKLNQTGGIADTLSFRFLIDAAIRGDSLLIADSRFRSEYKMWVDHTSAPVWALLEDWAIRRQYPVELMAADNILFNSRLSDDGLTVWIQPHIMIDLHDFEIIIDGAAGTMYAFPGGRTTSLKERLIPDRKHGILDPSTLHRQFCGWVQTHLGISDARFKGDRNLRQKVMGEKRLAGLVLLQQGKRLLFKGELERSVEAFEKARKSDLAAVYFWGAVAHEYRFLRDYRQDLVGVGNLDESAKRDRLLNAALHILIESLKPAAPKLSMQDLEGQLRAAGLSDVLSSRGGKGRTALVEQLLASSMTRALPLDNNAKVLLDQLRARDAAFVKGLIKDKPDIAALESASLNLTAAEEERLRAAMYAVSSLDFLSLAETMKTVARSMPFAGRPSSELRKELEEIVRRTRTLPLTDPPGAPQIEELTGLLGQS